MKNLLLSAVVLLSACAAPGSAAPATKCPVCDACYEMTVEAQRALQTGRAFRRTEVIVHRTCDECGGEAEVYQGQAGPMLKCAHCAPDGVSCAECVPAAPR